MNPISLTLEQRSLVDSTFNAEGRLHAIRLVRSWFDVKPEPEPYFNLRRAKQVVTELCGPPSIAKTSAPGFVGGIEVLTDDGSFYVHPYAHIDADDGLVRGVDRWTRRPGEKAAFEPDARQPWNYPEALIPWLPR